MRHLRILVLLALLIGFAILNQYYSLSGTPAGIDISEKFRTERLTGSLKTVHKGETTLDSDLPDKPNRSGLETIQCQVFCVDQIPLVRENTKVLNLMVETDEEILPVYLAPVWVFEKRGFYIRPKDSLILDGFRMSVSGYDTFVTTTIKKGDRMLRLRNSEGIPVWDRLETF